MYYNNKDILFCYLFYSIRFCSILLYSLFYSLLSNTDRTRPRGMIHSPHVSILVSGLITSPPAARLQQLPGHR